MSRAPLLHVCVCVCASAAAYMGVNAVLGDHTHRAHMGYVPYIHLLAPNWVRVVPGVSFPPCSHCHDPGDDNNNNTNNHDGYFDDNNNDDDDNYINHDLDNRNRNDHDNHNVDHDHDHDHDINDDDDHYHHHHHGDSVSYNGCIGRLIIRRRALFNINAHLYM